MVKETVKEVPKESRPTSPPRVYYPNVPYPSRLQKKKADSQFSELYDLLSKVNVNLPLLSVVTNIPSYAKFFKELSTRKRKFVPNEKIVVSEQVSAVLRKDLPPKLKDPGSFNIMISLGGSKKVRGMLDLGASINLMPYSLFQELKLGGLKPTTMTLQLADRSVKYPKGIVEDVLVQVDKLIIPVDFVVLDMDRDDREVDDVPILLGRPFMATANAIINVKDGSLSLNVMDKVVNFNIFDTMKRPYEANEVFFCDTSDNSARQESVCVPNQEDKKVVSKKVMNNTFTKVCEHKNDMQSSSANNNYKCIVMDTHELLSMPSVLELTNVQETKVGNVSHNSKDNERPRFFPGVRKKEKLMKKKNMGNLIKHGVAKVKSWVTRWQVKVKGRKFQSHDQKGAQIELQTLGNLMDA